MFQDHLLQLLQVVDAVVHEEHLTVSAHLEINGLSHNLGREGMYLSLNGITVGRRRLDDAQVTGTHQRELKGTRNGCGSHRKRVDIDFHLAQFLFHRYAKFLFLINDEQPQILEFHILTYQFMGTYDDVDLSFFQIVQHFFRLLRTTCPTDILHPYREVLQAFAECLIVLIGQNGSRHKDSHLFAVGCCLEGRTDGHFGLAESHIATHQTVHRLRLLHIGLHILGSFQLVGCIFIDKAGLQFMVHITVGTEGKACLLLTL